MRPPVVSTTAKYSSFASNRISFVKWKPSAQRCGTAVLQRAVAVGKIAWSACIQFFIRVDTVIQTDRARVAEHEFTLPMGSPSMLSASTRTCRRATSARGNRCRNRIRKSPFLANARPFGSVPADSASLAPACWKCPDWRCVTICCDPSWAICTTPLARRPTSVPSGSARMHSGRWRSCPTYRIAVLSMSKSRIGLRVTKSAPWIALW